MDAHSQRRAADTGSASIALAMNVAHAGISVRLVASERGRVKMAWCSVGCGQQCMRSTLPFYFRFPLPYPTSPNTLRCSPPPRSPGEGGVCGCGADPLDGGYALEGRLTRLGAPFCVASCCCLSGTSVRFLAFFCSCTRVGLTMVAFPSAPSSPAATGRHPHLTPADGYLCTPHHRG